MIYGVSVWGGTGVNFSNKFNIIQKRYLRILSDDNCTTSPEYSTRFSNNIELQVPYHRTTLIQRSNLYRSISLWNGLKVSIKRIKICKFIHEPTETPFDCRTKLVLATGAAAWMK